MTSVASLSIALGLLLSFGSLIVDAQQSQLLPTNSLSLGASTTSSSSNALVQMVGPGIYEIGKVRLDQRKRSVTLPATLDKEKGLMEYFLVTTYGKTHESVLKTTAEPFHIHMAMLLLGATGSGNPNFPGSPTNGVPGPIIHPAKDVIPGDKVGISVKWNGPKGVVELSAEELIYKNDVKTIMQRGLLVYNGSLMVHNKFLAQGDGSIVSLVTDPVALVNYIGPGHDNDMIWEPNPTNLPPADLPVEVTITLKDPPTKP